MDRGVSSARWNADDIIDSFMVNIFGYYNFIMYGYYNFITLNYSANKIVENWYVHKLCRCCVRLNFL